MTISGMTARQCWHFAPLPAYQAMRTRLNHSSFRSGTNWNARLGILHSNTLLPSKAARQAHWLKNLIFPQKKPNEWKTPALWGVADSAPYMHDGSAPTLRDAILKHGGDAKSVREKFKALHAEDQAASAEDVERRRDLGRDRRRAEREQVHSDAEPDPSGERRVGREQGE